MLTSLDDAISRIRGMPPEALAKIAGGMKNSKWIPNPGPQTQAANSLADILLFGGSAGSGKGFLKTQPVLTPFGWKPIGDLAVGSAINGTDGTVQKIIARYERGSQPLYKLRWSDGTETICDADHIWLAWRGGKSRKIENESLNGEGSAAKWVTSEIYKLYQRPKGVRLSRIGIPVISKPCVFNVHGENCGRYKHISRVIPPYILGVLIGDGCISGPVVRFSSADREIMDRVIYLLKGAFGENAKIIERYYGKKCADCLIPKDLCFSHLKDLGLMGHRADTKFIPRIYLFSSVEERFELLRGLMDTDGYVDKLGECYFTTISKQLSLDVAHLARSLGAIVSCSEKIPTFTYKGQKKKGRRAYTLRIKIPTPHRIFHLSRKIARCRDKVFQGMSVWLDDIKPHGFGETICIAVSNPNSLFITENFIVTHNSDLGLGLAFTRHRRSLVMRRRYTDLNALTERAIKINGSRDGFNGSAPPKLRTKDNRLIEFGAANIPGDEEQFQGQAHDLFYCVGRGTPVLMADGSYKFIEDLNIGDDVATLEGGRKVTQIFPIQKKEAIRIDAYNKNGDIIASQIQASNHKLLTNAGWVSSDRSFSSLRVLSSLPIEYQSYCKVLKWLCLTCAIPLCILVTLIFHPLRNALQWLFQPQLGQKGEREISSFGAQEFRESAYEECCDLHQENLPPLLSSVLPKLRLPVQRLGVLVSKLFHLLFLNGGSDEPRRSLFQDCLESYLRGFHFCDECIREFLGHCLSLVCVRLYLHQSNDVVQSIPTDSQKDDLGRIHGCIFHKPVYCHPYKKDKRLANAFVSINSFKVTPVGIVELFDIKVDELNHYITKGGFINKNCDEVAQFQESQIRFLMGWVRLSDTDYPDQRTRVVFGSNPPLTAEGDWMIKMFAPWLDMTHANPAKHGELRWFITDEQGNDVEVPSGQPLERGGKTYRPMSRTFIPGSVDENPFLATTGYKATLDSLPEPLRSAVRDGNFMAAREDDSLQVIPTAWIRAAQKRWSPQIPENVPMCAIGVDVAAGGSDATVISCRYDGWFAPLISVPGVKTPTGAETAGLVISHRRGGAICVVDCGGGYGGSVVEHLKANNIETVAYKGSHHSGQRTCDRTLTFVNKRAESWWRFREALDPGQEGGSGIALPDDTALVADLTTPRLKNMDIGAKGIQIESKEDIVKRLGRSPDRGDAVILAWSEGGRLATHYERWNQGFKPQKILGHEAQRRRF